MKKRGLIGVSVALLSSLALADEPTKVEEIKVPVNHCSAPVLNIVISEVECKAASCEQPKLPTGGMFGIASMLSGQGVSGVGKGVKSMLTNAIKETKCFTIVDMDQFEKVRKMMEATGQKVNPPKIDIIITGTISSVELNKEGGALGGGFIPIVGLVSKNTEKANMVLDIAAMNPTTMEIGETKSFKADSAKTSWGFGGYGGMAGGMWSVSKSIALDNVVRDVVFSTTNYLTETYAKHRIIDRPAPVKNEG